MIAINNGLCLCSAKVFVFTLIIMSSVVVYIGFQLSRENILGFSKRPIEISKNYKGPVETGYNIFFIESNINRNYLSARQLCSIESAAKHNSDATVHVKSLKATINHKQLLDKYPNIRFEIVTIADVLGNTPLAAWWKKDLITKSDYSRIAHTSDGMRLALLYEHGGFYADLDTITLKSLQPLLDYECGFVFQDFNQSLTNSFIRAQRKHPFVYLLLDSFGKIYDGDWATVGPNMITRYLPGYCNTTSLVSLLVGKNGSQCGIVTFPHTYHQPIHWTNVSKLFEPGHALHAVELDESYQIHFNSLVTGGSPMHSKSSNFYQLFASLNCPLTFKLAQSDK